jgi:hypothetical protein
MRWFRSNIRTGVASALFALAVQFAVTFSHVHLDGVIPPPVSHSYSQAAGHLTASLRKSGDTRGSPGVPDTDCPICALIQLAGTSAPSVAPPLPVPAMLDGSKLEPHAELRRALAPSFAFQARGPPSLPSRSLVASAPM